MDTTFILNCPCFIVYMLERSNLKICLNTVCFLQCHFYTHFQMVNDFTFWRKNLKCTKMIQKIYSRNTFKDDTTLLAVAQTSVSSLHEPFPFLPNTDYAILYCMRSDNYSFPFMYAFIKLMHLCTPSVPTFISWKP